MERIDTLRIGEARHVGDVARRIIMRFGGEIVSAEPVRDDADDREERDGDEGNDGSPAHGLISDVG
jgi:hypothetical protein